MLKELAKDILNKNSYVNNAVYSVLSNKKTEKLLPVLKDMQEWDLIQDVSVLKTFRQKVKNGFPFYTTDPNFSNVHIYGIWHEIFGKRDSGHLKYIETPSVEHGLIFHHQIFTDSLYTARAAIATFSSFRKKIIQSYLYRPVFCIGPYLHYADSFYGEETIRALKQRNGKTLLVFPAHSTDASELSVAEEQFCEHVRKIARNYDTVLINSFWWNINDPLIDKLESEGYTICSAGFRDDIKFMSRLKTIIRLSDYAIGDSIGTHVGYCIHEGVPYQLLDSESRVKLNNQKERRDLEVVHGHINQIRMQRNQNNEIAKESCERYWGFSEVKTQEEIKGILHVTKILFEAVGGNVCLENRMLMKYIVKNISSSLSEDEKALLRNAL